MMKLMFSQLLHRFRKVIIQDLPFLCSLSPDNVFAKHPICNDREYKAFAKESLRKSDQY